MPLINLQTNLKSLSYNGNGPYIEKDINNPGRPASEYIQGRVDDTTRMLRLLGDKGIAFTSKQALLLAGTKGLAAIPQAGNILANIVAQVPVNGTGTHFLPIDRNVYYTRVTDAAERSLYNGTVGGDNSPGTNNLGPFPEVTSRISETSKFKEATTPQSINALSPRDIYNTDQKTQPFRINTHRSARIQVLDDGTGIVQPTNNISLDAQYGFAESGKSDSINLLNIGDDTDPSKNIDDLVPIRFAVLGKTLTNINVLVFRGFIGTLSDRFSANWNSTRYVGRGENFYTYDHFSRGITFDFQLPIFSAAEQEPVITKLNSLSSITAPTYVDNLAQGKIITLEVGNYLRSKGILTEVGITVANEVPWSYGVGKNETVLLPQVYTVSINFTPIHSQTPQYYGTKAAANPFIAPDYVKTV